MKKIAILALLLLSLHVSAQTEGRWVTNHKDAMTLAENKNQNILVFVTADASTEVETLLNEMLFNSKAFQNTASKLVLLKLNASGSDAYQKRLAAHYTGVKTAPALSLVDASGNRVGLTLTTVNKASIKAFLSQLEAKLQ